MNRFAELLDRLAYEPGRNNKLRLITGYLREVDDPDRGYALAALTGVMFMVVIGTFAWQSFRIMRRIPLTDAFVIVLVTIVTVMHDLAVAVWWVLSFPLSPTHGTTPSAFMR